MPAPPLLDPPADLDSFQLAEWLETSMMLEGRDRMSRAEIRSRWPSGSEPDQAELDMLFGEIRRRGTDAERCYPFRADSGSCWRETSVDSVAYFLMLILSMEQSPYRDESRYNEVSPALELLTVGALKTQLGPRSEAVQFGWPSNPERPRDLRKAIPWLGELLGLKHGLVAEDLDEDDKDGGVDVVAWAGFPDGSQSFLVVLCQCTVQATYLRKAADVELTSWVRWLELGQSAISALSVPMAVPPDAKVRIRLRDRTSLLLDRLRIAALLDPDWLAARPEHGCLTAWVDAEITRLQTAITTPEAPLPRIQKRQRPRKTRPPRSDGPASSAAPTADVGSPEPAGEQSRSR